MAFRPPYCPDRRCPSESLNSAFLWRRDGRYVRAGDARSVQRFRCLSCGRRFSRQSFRLDYRQRKPFLNGSIFACLVSKVNHRQTARILRTDRKTVERRLQLWGDAMREYHEAQLERARRLGGLSGAWTLDEQETYERDRRLQPVTLPILVHWRAYFVLHAETAALPSRGNLSAMDRIRKEQLEAHAGPRRSGSSDAVERCLRAWKRVHRGGFAEFITDRKSTYPVLYKKTFGPQAGTHVRVASSETRNRRNPLFPINHTLAMLREHVSRLARRTWAASKLRRRLTCHLWIWIAWRNYVRGITNRAPGTTPAMAVGLLRAPVPIRRLLLWRHPLRMLPNTN